MKKSTFQNHFGKDGDHKFIISTFFLLQLHVFFSTFFSEKKSIFSLFHSFSFRWKINSDSNSQSDPLNTKNNVKWQKKTGIFLFFHSIPTNYPKKRQKFHLNSKRKKMIFFPQKIDKSCWPDLLMIWNLNFSLSFVLNLKM